MSVPSATELALLQTKPHNTKLWLSIYQPETVLACQLNATGTSKGMTTIPYDTVTAGSYSLVESEVFTMLVGTTAGGDEKGRIRVRSATASTITVPINSHINWADGDYLTIIRYVEINPVYQRIIQDPSDPLKTLWYKYSDVAYTNQNTVLGSFICMGGNYAGFIDNGQCQVYYTASGTHNLKNESMNFSWFFEGATVTGSSAHTPGYISYTTPGHYMTRLTVTTTGTASDTSYRFVSVYNRPGAGSNTPILNWEFTDLSGSRESGGYNATIKVRDMVYKSSIKDNALVVIFADDWYGNTKQSIGGNALNRSSIFYVGYILNGTITHNYQDGYIEFETASPTSIMSMMEGYAIDVTSSSDPAGQAASDPNYPSGWTLLLDMDVRRAIYHYLRWHSTVLHCTDFDVKHFGTDLPIQHFTSDRTSIYDAVNTLINGALYGEIVSDRQGRIFAEVAAYATNNASGTFATAIDIDKSVWYGDPYIEERQAQELSFIELGGIQYEGPSTNVSYAFLSNAPGTEPGLKGSMETREGLALSSQNQLNILAGNIFAWKNSRYPNAEFRIAGDWRNLDIAPQELASVTVAQTDTPRGISFSKKPFAIRGVSWVFDGEQELLLPTIQTQEIVQGFPGDTIIIPPVPPTSGDGTSGGGFNIPPFVLPPFPTIPGITLPTGTSQQVGMYLHPGVLTIDGSTTDTNGYIYWDGATSQSEDYVDPYVIFNGLEGFLIPVTGYYLISPNIRFNATTNGTSGDGSVTVTVSVEKNGSIVTSTYGIYDTDKLYENIPTMSALLINFTIPLSFISNCNASDLIRIRCVVAAASLGITSFGLHGHISIHRI